MHGCCGHSWLQRRLPLRPCSVALAAARGHRSVRSLATGLRYSLLHLVGYSSASMDDIKRLHSQDCLDALAKVMPELVGGSADTAPSDVTLMKFTSYFPKESCEERNFFHWGPTECP